MDKKEVQKRILKNGKQLDLDLFHWDERTKTLETKQSGLVIDFEGITGCTITTGHDSTITTGHDSTITTGERCAIVRRDIFEIIKPETGVVYQTCPNGISGHLIKFQPWKNLISL